MTRRDYNQLVAIDYLFFSRLAAVEFDSKYLANKWKSRNQALYDVDSGDRQITFVPQEFDIPFVFSFFHFDSRQTEGKSHKNLDSRRPSSRYRTLVVGPSPSITSDVI